MRAIFISYRRDDTEGYAGRLLQDLCDRFGKDSVFMDVAGIEPGRDFRRVIEQQVTSCGVLLALIGKSWLTVTDAQGTRRLDDPYDFVRLETASALKRDIPVIPVLVQQAEMPRAEQLPDELKDLAYRNNVELTHARWTSDVRLLITALMPYVDPKPAAATGLPPAPKPAPALGSLTWLVAPLATLAVAGIGYVTWDRLRSASQGPLPTTAPAARAAAASAMPASIPGTPIVEASSSTAPAMVTGNIPKRSVDKPALPQSASSRHVDKPAVGKAPGPASAPAPAPLPVLADRSAALPLPAVPFLATPPAPAPAAAEPLAPEVVAVRRDPSLDLFGSPGDASMITRTITIKPDTSFVNVTGGEVVRFEVGNKKFVWNFNGVRSSFDLARIVPPSTLDHKVTAYVAPNHMYPRRR